MRKTAVLILSCALCGFATGMERYKTFEAPHWKPADFPSPVVVPGSALDMSKIKPRYYVHDTGRLTVNNAGKTVFERHPEREVRLLGANSGFDEIGEVMKMRPEEWRKHLEDVADQLVTQGYDYVRTNCFLDKAPFEGTATPQTLNPVAVDIVDYWISVLRQRGLYMYGTLVSYQFGFPVWKQGMGQRTDLKCRTFYGEPEALDMWDRTVTQLLNHVNPYTGIAWKDDPVFLLLEFYNEQEICLYEVFIANRITPKGRNFILNGFAAFLERKYRTDEAMSKAWGRKTENFNHGLGVGKQPEGVAALDWEEYTMECGAKTYRHFLNTVRRAGYKGLVTNFNFNPTMNFSRLRAEQVDVTPMNSYFHHPSRWMNKGSRVGQDSSVAALAGYWRGNAATRLADRPHFVPEWNHCFWNPYVYEAGLVFPAYSALQNFSSLMAHAGQVIQKLPDSPGCFSLGALPTMRANEILSVLLFGRSDVMPSSHRVDVRLDRKYLESGEGMKCVNMQQSLTALICGFTSRFPEMPQRGTTGEADLELNPEPGAHITTYDWSATVSDESGSGIIQSIVSQLRQHGIIGSDNVTDPRKNIYQSDTGEITLSGNEKLLKITTPRTEGATLAANSPECRLNVLTMLVNTVPCAAAISSLDGREIAESSRLLLILNTMSANTGMILSADGTTMVTCGSLPVLLETGIFKGRLSMVPGRNFKLYPLSVNGMRREELPLSMCDGMLEFEIDTCKLPDGPTPFFELTAE